MKNRWIQLGALLVVMVMIANLQYAWTLFVNPIQTETHWTLTQIQWGFTFFILFETWMMPLEGWLIDRLGPRVFTTVAGVICGVGWGGLAFVHTPGQLYMSYAFAGVGAACIYGGSIAGALKWFPDRRGLAAGIISGGFGAGSALFIPPIHYVINTYGFRNAFLYTGIIQGIVIVVVAQILRHPDPDLLTKASTQIRAEARQFTTGEMLRTPHFYLLYLMFVLMATGGLLVTAQAGPVADQWGIARTALTAALALDRISNGLSRVFWGSISDRIGREITMCISFGLQACCLLSIIVFGRRSAFSFTLTLVLTFFTYGQVFSLFPSMIGDFFGSRHSTSNYSFLYSAKGVSSIIAGGLAALLFEEFHSWSAVLYGSAAMAAVSSVLALKLRKMPLPSKELYRRVVTKVPI